MTVNSSVIFCSKKKKKKAHTQIWGKILLVVWSTFYRLTMTIYRYVQTQQQLRSLVVAIQRWNLHLLALPGALWENLSPRILTQVFGSYCKHALKSVLFRQLFSSNGTKIYLTLLFDIPFWTLCSTQEKVIHRFTYKCYFHSLLLEQKRPLLISAIHFSLWCCYKKIIYINIYISESSIYIYRLL